MTHDKLHDVLAELYLDWVNNFLSRAAFARHYGISEEFANAIINAGRTGSIHN